MVELEHCRAPAQRSGLMDKPRIIAFATKGAGSNEEARLAELLRLHAPKYFEFDRERKFKSFRVLLKQIADTRPELVAMEGTGVAGGLACILGRLLYGVPYVF